MITHLDCASKRKVVAMSAPQMLVLMIVALQMQGLFTKQFLVETEDDIPNDGRGRGRFQNKALSELV